MNCDINIKCYHNIITEVMWQYANLNPKTGKIDSKLNIAELYKKRRKINTIECKKYTLCTLGVSAKRNMFTINTKRQLKLVKCVK